MAQAAAETRHTYAALGRRCPSTYAGSDAATYPLGAADTARLLALLRRMPHPVNDDDSIRLKQLQEKMPDRLPPCTRGAPFPGRERLMNASALAVDKFHSGGQVGLPPGEQPVQGGAPAPRRDTVPAPAKVQGTFRDSWQQHA